MNQINQPTVTSSSHLTTAEHARNIPDVLPNTTEPSRATSPIVLAALQSIIRRPPLLQLRKRHQKKDSVSETILQEILDTPDTNSMGGMAFDIASILIQHGHRFSQSSDPEIVEGFVLLGKIATMYEHLFIMQTGQGSNNHDN